MTGRSIVKPFHCGRSNSGRTSRLNSNVIGPASGTSMAPRSMSGSLIAESLCVLGHLRHAVHQQRSPSPGPTRPCGTASRPAFAVHGRRETRNDRLGHHFADGVVEVPLDVPFGNRHRDVTLARARAVDLHLQVQPFTRGLAFRFERRIGFQFVVGSDCVPSWVIANKTATHYPAALSRSVSEAMEKGTGTELPHGIESTAMKTRSQSPAANRRSRAGDGIRTHDNHVGNVMLYQLSYTRA